MSSHKLQSRLTTGLLNYRYILKHKIKIGNHFLKLNIKWYFYSANKLEKTELIHANRSILLMLRIIYTISLFDYALTK